MRGSVEKASHVELVFYFPILGHVVRGDYSHHWIQLFLSVFDEVILVFSQTSEINFVLPKAPAEDSFAWVLWLLAMS